MYNFLFEHTIIAALFFVISGVLAFIAVARLLKPAFRFERQPLMNKSERGLYSALGEAVMNIDLGHMVFSQVSLGEFLRSSDMKMFYKINSKRTDFLIVDKQMMPVLSIEYQGSGHYGRTRESAEKARVSDFTKEKACLSAGMKWLPVMARYKRAEVISQVVSLIKDDAS